MPLNPKQPLNTLFKLLTASETKVTVKQENMDNTETEIREEENTTENGQEYDAVGGGHSIDSSSDEWDDTTPTEVCEENVR